MAIADGSGRIEIANEALSRITGHPATELAGWAIEDLVLAHDDAIGREERERLISGEVGSYEGSVELRRADGSPVWVALTATRDDGANPVTLIYQVQDISERRALEGQLRYLVDHDLLTGLFNRRRFDEELERQIQRHHADGRGRSGPDGRPRRLQGDQRPVRPGRRQRAPERPRSGLSRSRARDRRDRPPLRRRVRRPAARSGSGDRGDRRRGARHARPRLRLRHGLRTRAGDGLDRGRAVRRSRRERDGRARQHRDVRRQGGRTRPVRRARPERSAAGAFRPGRRGEPAAPRDRGGPLRPALPAGVSPGRADATRPTNC